MVSLTLDILGIGNKMLITVLVPFIHHSVPEWIKILDQHEHFLASVEKGCYANGISYSLDGELEAIKDWLEPMTWIYRKDGQYEWNEISWNNI